MSAAIGIDLGTTACCMAIYRQGQLEVIPNDQGHFTTPSYVAFTGNQRLIGSAAEAQAHRNPSQTLYDAKRLIGRCFDDANVEQLKKNWNFLVVDKENKPMFSTEKPDGSCMLLAPQQVSGMILSKLKKDAESYLARSVTEAVITVPAYFNNAQREATEAAARIAGIKPLRLINEPTAAILSYGHDKKFSVDSKTVLVYDFGGGTLDITIADVDGGVVDVLTTSGDTNLGGRDIDAVVAKYMVQFVDQQCGKGILKVGKAYMRLEKACNEAKHALSTASRAPVVVDGLVNSNDFSTHIIRARFEDLVQPILDRTMKCVEEALEKAKMSGDKIDVVLLVGGSSRIPKIAHMLKVMMTKAEVVYCGNPEESVARGAAVQANILSCEDPYLNAVVLVDVCPLSLGLLTKDNIYSRVIKRSSNIPCEVSQVYRTCFDHQKGILFKVYEGERAIATENNKLGEFRLENIKDALKGEVSYDVTFTLNADGILHVKAVERGTGLSKDITIKKESLDPNDLGAMIEDEEKFAAKDELEVKRIAAKQDLEEYLYELNKRKSPGPSSKLGIKIAEAEKWIDENLNATVEEFKSKKKTFQKDI